jgi:hypothetical protein
VRPWFRAAQFRDELAPAGARGNPGCRLVENEDCSISPRYPHRGMQNGLMQGNAASQWPPLQICWEQPIVPGGQLEEHKVPADKTL